MIRVINNLIGVSDGLDFNINSKFCKSINGPINRVGMTWV